jgi:hypothetical protein
MTGLLERDTSGNESIQEGLSNVSVLVGKDADDVGGDFVVDDCFFVLAYDVDSEFLCAK